VNPELDSRLLEYCRGQGRGIVMTSLSELTECLAASGSQVRGALIRAQQRRLIVIEELGSRLKIDIQVG
jgi:hypothetical protein